MALYTGYTWQDWQAEGMETASSQAKAGEIEQIVSGFMASSDFQGMLDANLYFHGESPVIDKKTLLRARVITVETGDGIKRNKIENEEIAGNRIADSMLFRFVTQQCQYLLGNGVTLGDQETKQRLGVGFDTAMQQMGENALLHGVSYGFWNMDHLEPISACRDANSGFVPLLDELTGVIMAGLQFWRVSDSKPLCVRLFEQDGITMYRQHDGHLTLMEEKRPYVASVYTDAMGKMLVDQHNYNVLPIIPLYANEGAASELTPSIRSKIDLYDRILSDFGDNLDRANDVYWVLNNFGGDVSSITQMFEYINKLKAVVNQSDGMGGSGSTAEPRTLEVPYQARKEALEILRKGLYDDYMALDMDALTGGSLTNVAIKVAYAAMDLKANRFEWQAFSFVQAVLKLLGIETEEIRFNRQSISNDQEIISNIYLMRSDIDHATALRLNPYIMEEEIDQIIQNVEAEGQTGMPSVEALQDMMDAEKDGDDQEDEDE